MRLPLVASLELDVLFIEIAARPPGGHLPSTRHRSICGRRIWNVTAGLRIMLRVELPVIESLSTTMLPSVNAPAPEPPFIVRHVVSVPQLEPLPEWKYMNPESRNCPPPPQLGFAAAARF